MFQKEEPKPTTPTDASSPGAAAAATGAVPPNNVPPHNPYAAMFNPAAMGGMPFQGQMFPFPPNPMNPAGFNNQQLPQTQSNQSATGTTPTSQSVTSSNSNTTNQQASTSQSGGAGQQSTPATPNTPELRQRPVGGRSAQAAQGGARTDPPLIRRGPARQGDAQSSITVPLTLMAVITCIMVFLILRRIYRTMEYKFDFDM